MAAARGSTHGQILFTRSLSLYLPHAYTPTLQVSDKMDPSKLVALVADVIMAVGVVLEDY